MWWAGESCPVSSLSSQSRETLRDSQSQTQILTLWEMIHPSPSFFRLHFDLPKANLFLSLFVFLTVTLFLWGQFFLSLPVTDSMNKTENQDVSMDLVCSDWHLPCLPTQVFLFVMTDYNPEVTVLKRSYQMNHKDVSVCFPGISNKRRNPSVLCCVISVVSLWSSLISSSWWRMKTSAHYSTWIISTSLQPLIIETYETF